jgi:hypothetical protein
MAASPLLEYLFRHNRIVGTDVPSLRARERLARPSAAPRTMFTLNRILCRVLSLRLIAINCWRSESSRISRGAGGSGIARIQYVPVVPISKDTQSFGWTGPSFAVIVRLGYCVTPAFDRSLFPGGLITADARNLFGGT